MKIEILNTTAPYAVAYTLMAGGAQSPEGMRMDAEYIAQIQNGLRATDVQAFNRGNMEHRFEFSSTRSYNTIADAETALMDFPYAVPTSGIIKFTPETPVGGIADPSLVRYMRNATVKAFAANMNGTAIVWRFSLVGGSVTNTPPP